MAQSDARFGYRADLKRSDHDLSQKRGFTTPPGMLNPIWFDLATPGDSYYMEHNMPLLRSNVLAAPSMVDVNVHYETFFVPLQMLYQPIENTLFSIDSLQSSLYGDTSTYLNSVFPVIDYSDFITEIKALTDNGELRANAFRLADLLGLNAINWCTSYAPQEGYTPNFFPYQLLCYQCIFQYYYRLDDKSSFTPQFFNMDRFYATSTPVTGNAFGLDLWRLNSRPWDFDYFTSLYRSPLVSDANMQQILPTNRYSDLNSVNTIKANASGGPTASNEQTRDFSSYIGTSHNNTELINSISTAAIRQIFANEKLAMITGRTRKNYDSQVLAHYGVNVPHDVKHDITMIHHDVYHLNVQEVTSLASTSDAPLGDLAGKSYAAGNGEKFKFTAPCHGVIMTIFSVEPRKRYFGGFDKINSVTNAFDLPTPEFDRLGNQPMYRYESGFSALPSDTRTNADIIGWKERYYQFKRKHDVCSWAFGYGNQYSTTNTWSSYMLAFLPFATYEDSNNRPQQRPDLSSRFYIEWSAMDALCLVRYKYGWKSYSDADHEDWNATPWLLYQRDPFIVNSHIICKKVSWMSKDGEPIYDF